MMLSYYTKICIPIIGLNMKQIDFHYTIIVHNAEHEQISNTIKIIIHKINYISAIQLFEKPKKFDNILLTARSPPVFLVITLLCSYYRPNIRRW